MADLRGLYEPDLDFRPRGALSTRSSGRGGSAGGGRPAPQSGSPERGRKPQDGSGHPPSQAPFAERRKESGDAPCCMERNLFRWAMLELRRDVEALRREVAELRGAA